MDSHIVEQMVTAWCMQWVSQYKKDYRRGWRCSESANGGLDNHNFESAAWYDGYFDYSAGREQWHSMVCENYDVIAGHSYCNNYGGLPQ